MCVCAQLLSHVRLCNIRDCSPPDYSIHGMFQARIPEGVAIPLPRGSSQPRDQTCVSCLGRWLLLPLSHLGSLHFSVMDLYYHRISEVRLGRQKLENSGYTVLL